MTLPAPLNLVRRRGVLPGDTPTEDGGWLPPNPLVEGRHWEVDPETGCWNWLMYAMRGYARHRLGPAHRVVYRQYGGLIPADHDLHHRCENPLCVNPEHMEPRDKVTHLRSHWRRAVDRADGRIPATPEQIDAIKQWIAREPRAKSHVIAEEIGLRPEHVRTIINRRTWNQPGEALELRLTCIVCGKQIEGVQRRTKKYCTDDCKRAAAKARARKVA